MDGAERGFMVIVLIILLGLGAVCSEKYGCPSLRDPILKPEFEIPWGTTGRAWQHVPREVVITKSKIPRSGLGVLSNTFLSKWTWLGEYEGVVLPLSSNVSDYAANVFQNGNVTHYIDGEHTETSSWVRYINCARHVREENVAVYFCRGRIYMVTSQEVVPGTELLVYYGPAYASILHIDARNYYNMTITDPAENTRRFRRRKRHEL